MRAVTSQRCSKEVSVRFAWREWGRGGGIQSPYNCSCCRAACGDAPQPLRLAAIKFSPSICLRSIGFAASMPPVPSSPFDDWHLTLAPYLR